MLHYLEVGGPILWVLVIISIGAFAVVLERIVFFARNEKNVGSNFKDEILLLVASKKLDEAIALCDTKKSCVASAVRKFLQKAPKGIDVQDYEFILKEVTNQEISPYERRLNLLASVMSISPMLGLLGTVTGMIRAFTNISKYGAGDAAIVADGIAEALLTTAAGLMIAIPVIVVYNYLNRRLEKMENEIDDVITNIINIFRR
ncbi:MotA/TolQ/ExbB proton channel family protein [Fusobacterium nucleatum subsp. nucleatum ATCC 25586]|uniref:Biopolymer transport exbB protein n=2 Tax=Fusobacterium nucleatum subsp. nucleatum TaxID=76856 RepID=Q8RE19_FUSNN|nr:MotA/TolQ/ExbB proton channel family protein [Fusobacterium nucleatum]AAL95508.1 Biopolymer transport exbB protein [Fusobacterium nucleatum subsp. nucleatum ATCC 25586]ALF24686.1 biopolymer transporter ExbB [Fusobacterium nucleatum subsp. nucleatum ChDC F316]ASG26074.1 biopolymer transporter ExbB [Fusobacterium nucleatum subsp. nucleatum]AVQ15629.1 MotA/TolQ/ExbB proton channel family protein [Fusobacterium nucleatum subsp. nucleatum ATCC 25586]KUL99183.1 biopolymer transporter ExbB [Fusoba